MTNVRKNVFFYFLGLFFLSLLFVDFPVLEGNDEKLVDCACAR